MFSKSNAVKRLVATLEERMHGDEARGFRRWHRVTVQHERLVRRAKMEAAARVIQRLARSFLYRMKGKAFLLSYAKTKMRELKAMRRALTHEAATRRLRRHWRLTRGEGGRVRFPLLLPSCCDGDESSRPMTFRSRSTRD